MPLVTASGCRRQEANGAGPLARWQAMVNRPALTGDQVLLARHVENALLLIFQWFGLAGVLWHRTCRYGMRSCQILTLPICSTLTPARVVSR